eukprot:gene4946-6_t
MDGSALACPRPQMCHALSVADAISLSVEANDVHYLAYLAARDVSLATPCGPKSCTALHLAAQHGNAHLCKALISLGVDVGAVNSLGQTAADVAHEELTPYLQKRLPGTGTPLPDSPPIPEDLCSHPPRANHAVQPVVLGPLSFRAAQACAFRPALRKM